MIKMKKVVVTLTDRNYYFKARQTIIDARMRGKWRDDLVLISVDFDVPTHFLEMYNVIEYKVHHINTDYLLEQYKKCPIRPTCDNREFAKLSQWDKFYVFSDWFKKWERVLYVDAGLRILDNVEHLMSMDCSGVIMAPDDSAPYDNEKRFGAIIETDRNTDVVNKLFEEYSPDILGERYFLNCIWMYDTQLLDKVKFQDLVDSMNRYPICRCNEMTIMNLLFTFKNRVWRPFPDFTLSGKRLFTWTENDRNYDNGLTWSDYCFIKYSNTLRFD
jgi:hypothetical protein